jgi:hypothetical protein
MDVTTALRLLIEVAEADRLNLRDDHVEAVRRLHELLVGLEDGSVNIE